MQLDPSNSDTPQPSGIVAKLQLGAPWKLANEVKRILVAPAARLIFLAARIQWGRGWRIYGLPIIQKHHHTTIQIGANLSLRSTARSNPLGPNRPVVISTRRAGATIVIGGNFRMTGGSIVAAEKIVIGNNINVGANTIISDTDFHPLHPVERQRNPTDGATAPIIIEDDVFIGMQCLILKGVTIGEGSVIGAGSVVTKDIPPGVIAAGNPARVIRDL